MVPILSFVSNVSDRVTIENNQSQLNEKKKAVVVPSPLFSKPSDDEWGTA